MELEELLQRHRAFWHRGKVDRPLVTIKRFSPLVSKHIPVADPAWQARKDVEVLPGMFDTAAFANQEHWHSTPGRLVMGDTFSVRGPYVRIPWMEAILGCSIWLDRDSGSMWSEPFLTDLRQWERPRLSPDNPWLRKMLDCTRYLVEHDDGSYLVTQTLMRGPIDMVRAYFGDSETCVAIMDHADKVAEILDGTTDVFIDVHRANLALTPTFHDGYGCYFGIWAPDTVVRTQCDMSALLSPRVYKELVLPFEAKVCRPFAYSLIHLHSGFLHTVDALLETEYPTAIEIALDTGSTPVSAREVIEICRKILKRKPVLLEGEMTAADVEYAYDTLPAEGLYLGPSLSDAEIARLRPALREFVADVPGGSHSQNL
ncbi:MAG: hypothetical protein ACYC3S_16930 [Chloroflexota bacterium]